MEALKIFIFFSQLATTNLISEQSLASSIPEKWLIMSQQWSNLAIIEPTRGLGGFETGCLNEELWMKPVKKSDGSKISYTVVPFFVLISQNLHCLKTPTATTEHHSWWTRLVVNVTKPSKSFSQNNQVDSIPMLVLLQ